MSDDDKKAVLQSIVDQDDEDKQNANGAVSGQVTSSGPRWVKMSDGRYQVPVDDDTQLGPLARRISMYLSNNNILFRTGTAEDDALARGFVVDTYNYEKRIPNPAYATDPYADPILVYREKRKGLFTASPPRVKELLHGMIQPIKHTRKSGDPYDAPVPKDLVDMTLDQGLSGAKMLSSVVTHPIIRSGQLISGNIGYDEQSTSWIESDEMQIGSTIQDAGDALKMLLEHFKPFPFASKNDALRNICFLMTLATRRASSVGQAPMIRVRGPVKNIGKTWLPNINHVVITGELVTPITYSTNEAEFQKIFVSVIKGAPLMVLIDEVPNGWTVADRVLNAYATSSSGWWSDRELGHSKKIVMSTSPTIVLAGINITGTDTINSRTLDINLLPRSEEHPELRNMYRLTMDKRLELLEALTVLNGCRYTGDGPLPGRMKDWLDIVAGPIVEANSVLMDGSEYAGSFLNIWDDKSEEGEGLVNEELANIIDWMASVQDPDQDHELLGEKDETGKRWISVDEIISHCEEDAKHLFRKYWPADGGPNLNMIRQYLSGRLQNSVGRNGLMLKKKRLEVVGKRTKPWHFRAEPLAPLE